jgi:hypothetical protein
VLRPPYGPPLTFPSVEAVAVALLDHGAVDAVQVINNRGVRRDLKPSELR